MRRRPVLSTRALLALLAFLAVLTMALDSWGPS